MSKYHISNNTGKPEKCSAEKISCPISGNSEHYSSLEEANIAAEEKFSKENNVFKSTSVNKTFNNPNDVEKIIENPDNFTGWKKLTYEQADTIVKNGIRSINEKNAENVIDIFKKLNDNGQGTPAKKYIYDLLRVRPGATKNLPTAEKHRLHDKTIRILEEYKNNAPKKRGKNFKSGLVPKKQNNNLTPNNPQEIIKNPNNFTGWKNLTYEQADNIVRTGIKEINEENAENVIDVFKKLNDSGKGEPAKKYLHDLLRVRPGATKNLPTAEKHRLHDKTTKILEEYNETFRKKKVRR